MVQQALRSLDLWVGGRPVPAADGGRYLVVNPYTGRPVAEAARAGETDARRAVDAAAAAFPVWSRLSGNDRANILYRAYFGLRARAEELVEVLVAETGKARQEAAKEIRSTGAFLRFCAEEARRIFGDVVPSPDPGKRVVVEKQPVGVVAAFTAVNAPGIIFGRKVAPALAAGCTVVAKPAEEAPGLAVALAEVLAEAGLPAGALNVVFGDAPAVAAALIADPRVRLVSFTGSAAVGRQIMRLAAENLKRVVLELGGVSPFIVFDDADLGAAARGLVAAKFRHAGQICGSPQRVFIQETVADRFIPLLLAEVDRLRVGDPALDDTSFGPVQHGRNLEKVERFVADALAKGAVLLRGGRRLGGLTYAPTVLEGITGEMLLAREEVFGPVLGLERFREEDEAIRRANETPYGLVGYVYTRDLSRAFRVAEALEVGVVGINDPFPATVEGPFGGVKQSGFGLEGGRYGVEEFLVKKQLSFQL